MSKPTFCFIEILRFKRIHSLVFICHNFSSSITFVIYLTTRSLAQQHEVLITVEEGSKGGFGAHGN